MTAPPPADAAEPLTPDWLAGPAAGFTALRRARTHAFARHVGGDTAADRQQVHGILRRMSDGTFSLWILGAGFVRDLATRGDLYAALARHALTLPIGGRPV